MHADSRMITICDCAREQSISIVYFAHAPDHNMCARARGQGHISCYHGLAQIAVTVAVSPELTT